MRRLLCTLVLALPLPSATAAVLTYGTYLGGDGNETAHAVHVTPGDEVFVVGETDSANFPTPNGLQPFKGAGVEAFLARFDASNQLVYGTYLGGTSSGDEAAYAVTVDSSGRIYIAGSSLKNGNEQVFVVRLAPDGRTLQYSATFGGSGADRALGIAVDAAGNAYVTGYTESFDFPVLNSIHGYGGGKEVFVVRLNNSGTITYGTFLGNDNSEQTADAIVYDPAGFVWITGVTRKVEPNGQAFVTRLNFNATFPEAGEFGRSIGGNSWDEGFGIALDASGNALVAGRAWSDDLPVTGAGFGQTYPGSSSCFVARVTPANVLDKLAYVDVFPGAGNSEDCHALALRGSDLWIAADTGWETGAARMRADLSAYDFGLKFEAGYGGWQDDGHGIAVRSSGRAVVVGHTFSSGFPATDDAYQQSDLPLGDAFVEEVGPGTPVLTISDCSVNEPALPSNQVDCVLKAQLSAASPGQVYFNWDTTPNTADGTDFWSTTGSASYFNPLLAGRKRFDMPVRVDGDDLDEINETFYVDLTEIEGSISVADMRGIGTIVDTDAAPVLSVAGGGCSTTEGNSGTVNCAFVYQLSAVSGRDVTFSTATANGTATAGSDYNALTASTRTIPVGQTTLTVNVPVRGDTLDEANETFTLNATSISGATPATLAATGTITDDDVAPSLSIDNGGCTVTESTGSAVNCNFVFRLSTASGRDVTFNTATANSTATAGADYTAHASTARTIAAGQTTLSVAVPVLGDSTDEGSETFTLSATGIANATPASLTGTGTINDNDAAPTLTVDNGGCSATEGDAGSVNCAFVFRLSAPSALAVTFNTATGNGTATAGSDYTAHASTARTIAAGQTALTVNVPVLGDTIDEPNETFALNASGVTNATPGTLSATGTIADNDLPPVLSVDNGGCSTTEGNTNCAFVFRLSATSASAVTFNTATANGTATAGSDYTAHTSTARTIAAGQTSLTVNVPVLADALDEADETFTLDASAVTNATPGTLAATGTVVDDDAAPTLSVDTGGCTATEGDSGSTNCTFTYRLSAASGRAVTFNTATANGTATAGSDYTSHASTARTLAAGQTSLTINVPVLGDTRDEPNETFTLAATSIANATPATLNATGTITDDDAAPTLSVDAGGCTVTEGNSGSLSCAVVYRLSAASGLAVTFNTATANGSATAGADYTAHASTARSIAAGQTTLTVNVPVLGDTTDEPVETFALNATAVANATPGTLAATGTIADDDAAPALSVDNGGCSVTEGIGGTRNCDFVYRLAAASGFTVTFTTQTVDGTANSGSDYTAQAATARSIPAGQTTLTVPVAVSGDAIDEANETFALSATAIANATPASLAATGTIIDDDGVPTLSIGDCTATETDSGTAPCTFTVSLSNASAQTVTASYASADGTALAPGDYIATSGTLSFAPGETSKTFAVPVVGDTRNELPIEGFALNLSTPGNATLADAQGAGSIADNDPLPALRPQPCLVAEGNSGTSPCLFQVSLTPASGRTVTVAYATADGDATAPADYLAASGTLSFAPGETQKAIAVSVVGDTIDEGNQGFTLNLSAPGAATLALDSAIGAIADDDAPAGQLRFTRCRWSVGEQAGSVAIGVERVGGSLGAVSVPWSMLADTATPGQDYTNASGTLSWASGEAGVKSFSIAVLSNPAVEPTETLELLLGEPTGGATLGVPGYFGFVDILDADAQFRDGLEDVTDCGL